MLRDGRLYMAQGDAPCYMEPGMINRHGLIAGASGTGKTITLKVMAESLSAMGVPVFLADVKGDLAGMCQMGVDSESMRKRIAKLGLNDFAYRAFPTRFWDVFGEGGHPVRTTISEMGPMLLARLLDLTEIQEGVLSLAFRVADDNGLLLLDMKDLRAMLRYVSENRAQLAVEYGTASPQSVGAIQRALLKLEDQGGEIFFGEPALDVNDWMAQDAQGCGLINVLHCARLIHHPDLYAAFMLWLLSELYENMPEVGDLEKPRMVFFFDEAHLLFKGAPKALVEKVEQVIKLIRSKGVGIYFITQSPSDLPDSVLAQLSNRVQHALRAYTPAEQKAVRVAAQSFRPNPSFDAAQAIGELGVGEALVSFLDAEGVPGVVQRAWILPPQSRMGLIEDGARAQVIAQSGLGARYDRAIDRESAYELLERHAQMTEEAAERARLQAEREEEQRRRQAQWEKEQTRRARELERAMLRTARQAPRRTPASQKRATTRRSPTLEQMASKAAGQALGSFGRSLGNQLMRGLFGSLRR